MVLPSGNLKLKKQAEKAANAIDSIEHSAKLALQVGTNINIINLYSKVVRSGAMFSQMGDDGYPIEVLGPVIGADLGFDWTAHEAEFIDLKDVCIPAFAAAVLANESEILARSFNSTAVITDTPISTETLAILNPLIQAIVDKFES